MNSLDVRMATPALLSQLEASWAFLVDHRPSGQLELHRSASGYAWRWANKPAHLVDLLGVKSASNLLPWWFQDLDAAVEHLMKCTGIAFAGRCALIAGTGEFVPLIAEGAANDQHIVSA